MKRIGVAQILQESNSFNPVPTTRAEFERFGLGLGDEVPGRFGEVDEIGGFLEGLRAWPERAAPVGIIRAQGWPGGPLSKDTRQWFIRTLRERLALAGRLDGLLFALHGAMMAEDETDADGGLLEEARRALGPMVPIVATLDLPAHVTARMVRAADALVAYHTSPHLDRRGTGVRAARVLERILAGSPRAPRGDAGGEAGARPSSASVRLPMISIAEAQNTFGKLLAPVFERVRGLEKTPEVLSAAVLMTQSWLDAPNLGWSTLVVTDAAPDLARRLAEELADMCWERRRGMTVEFRSAEESIALALACEGRPVVVADGADATNSGAGGDSTHLLRQMVGRRIPGGALTIIVDPSAVAHARAAGEGGRFRFAVGGKRDHIFSKPLEVSGEVLSLKPARYVLSGHGGNNLSVDMGMSATVRIGDVTLLLVEAPGPGSTPAMYRCVGLEPKDFKIVIVKSPAGFRAEYEPFAVEIILSDCPGCASPHYAGLPYTRISRPLWPLDDIEDRRGVDWVKGEGRCE